MLREKLFRNSRPFVRPFDFNKDSWVLWGAYDLNSFPNMTKGLQPEQFMEMLKNFVSSKSSVLIIEDDHKYFRKKRGPVALVSIDNYGWRVEPQIDFFFWASKRQRLRAAVSFLQVIRHAREVGVCVVRVSKKDARFCDYLQRYDPISRCGEIPQGRPDGDELLYYMKGKKGWDEMKRAA